MFSKLKGRSVGALVASVGLLAVTGSALADTPPPMGTVPEIIDWTSIGTSLGVAGAAILAVVMIYKAGFKVVQKVFSRVLKSI